MRLRPSEIFYTQDSIGNTFNARCRHRCKMIGETLDDICEGRCSITAIPTISVAYRDCKWRTVDNRRLWVFRQLEILGKCDEIQVCQTRSIPAFKNTSRNGGQSVRVRGYGPGGQWFKVAEGISLSKTDNIRTYRSEEWQWQSAGPMVTSGLFSGSRVINDRHTFRQNTNWEQERFGQIHHHPAHQQQLHVKSTSDTFRKENNPFSNFKETGANFEGSLAGLHEKIEDLSIKGPLQVEKDPSPEEPEEYPIRKWKTYHNLEENYQGSIEDTNEQFSGQTQRFREYAFKRMSTNHPQPTETRTSSTSGGVVKEHQTGKYVTTYSREYMRPSSNEMSNTYPRGLSDRSTVGDKCPLQTTNGARATLIKQQKCDSDKSGSGDPTRMKAWRVSTSAKAKRDEEFVAKRATTNSLESSASASRHVYHGSKNTTRNITSPQQASKTQVIYNKCHVIVL